MIRSQRHDILAISDAGRRWAVEHLSPANVIGGDPAQAAGLIAGQRGGIKIPGIVRRHDEDGIEGAIPVGFSSPDFLDHRRMRVAAFVPEKEIAGITSPYQVLSADFALRTECLKALAAIKKVAADMGIRLGVWGSAGLEVYTGLPYTHAASDLDLLVPMSEPGLLRAFAGCAAAVGRRHGCRLDIEVDLPSGYGVKLLELLQDTDLVLGKSLAGVQLRPRANILNSRKEQ